MDHKITCRTQMARNIILLMATLFAVQFAVPSRGFAQNWKKSFTSPSLVYWVSVASSADGTKLIAVGNSSPTGASAIYTSTNSGTTWMSNSAPFAIWSGVACSADGTKLVAVAGTGSIWISTNFGVAWFEATNAPVMDWSSVASSDDGVRLVAAAVSDQVLVFTNGEMYPPTPTVVPGNGLIYTSTNSGMNWISNNYVPPSGWSRVISSGDGNQLYATGGFLGIYHSTNAGINWSAVSSPLNYAVSIAGSADGRRLFATGFDALSDGIWATSTNSGQTWSTNIAPNPPSGGYGWRSIASSGDGIKLAAADYHTPIYTSTDSGITWVTNNAPSEDWLSIASSADGSKLVALANFGDIFTWQYQPVLRLAGSRTHVTVSWPDSPFAIGFVLQQNFNLFSTNWTNVTESVNDDGTNFSITLVPRGTALFFRLRK